MEAEQDAGGCPESQCSISHPHISHHTAPLAHIHQLFMQILWKTWKREDEIKSADSASRLVKDTQHLKT